MPSFAHIEISDDEVDAIMSLLIELRRANEGAPQTLSKRARRTISGDQSEVVPWDPKSVAVLVEEAIEAEDDGHTERLLKYMARSDIAGNRVSSRDVANELGMDSNTLAGVLGPLNKRAKNEHKRPAPIQRSLRKVTEGGVRASRSFLSMDREFAVMVRRAFAEAGAQ